MTATPAKSIDSLPDMPDVEDMADSVVQEALSFGLSQSVIQRGMKAVMDKTIAAMPNQWQPMDALPANLQPGDTVDLFGYISYDKTLIRLTECDKRGGEWHYFQAGEMLPVSGLSFTPTQWMFVTLPEN